MGEPCVKCESPATGQEVCTPIGICLTCACENCRGFRQFDDRGFLYSGNWPTLFFTDCLECKGTGLRAVLQSTVAREGE